MASFGGAKRAIRERLEAGWTSTRITYQNKTPADPWPPKAPGGKKLAPWVNLEIKGLPSSLRGAGVPGKQVWLKPGFIYVHVFVPTGSGDDDATDMADAIGELFKGAVFYQVAPGCYVRCWAPHVDGGGSGDDDGNWFRVTMSVPFEYWHRG